MPSCLPLLNGVLVRVCVGGGGGAGVRACMCVCYNFVVIHNAQV